MIPRYIRAQKNSWVMATELPADEPLLMLEGIKTNTEEGFTSERIIFSLEAVKQLVPLMQEWLEAKNWENIHKEGEYS